MKKTAILLVLAALIIFLAILMFTGWMGALFGKRAELVSLIAVAIILTGLLVWNQRS